MFVGEINSAAEPCRPTGPLTVCYAYEYDAADIKIQSGRPYFILEQLRSRYLLAEKFPLDLRARYVYAPLKIFHRVTGRQYHAEREPILLASVAAQIRRHVSANRPNVIFAPSS